MKSIVVLFAMLSVVSCGKKVTKKYYENKFDDTSIQNKLIAHEARLSVLEDKVRGLFDSDGNVLFLTEDQVDDKLSIIDTLATKNELMEIKNICDSSEMLLKSGDSLYAVISTVTKETITFKDCTLGVLCEDRSQEFEKVSNVHLGKLTNGSYRLTDGSDVTFTVTDSVISNCSNAVPL